MMIIEEAPITAADLIQSFADIFAHILQCLTTDDLWLIGMGICCVGFGFSFFYNLINVKEL